MGLETDSQETTKRYSTLKVYKPDNSEINSIIISSLDNINGKLDKIQVNVAKHDVRLDNQDKDLEEIKTNLKPVHTTVSNINFLVKLGGIGFGSISVIWAAYQIVSAAQAHGLF